MNQDLIFVNGDSFSAKPPNGLKVYSDALADHFDVPVINIGQFGGNNDRIFRSTIEAVLYCLKNDQRPFVIMAMSFVRRQEVWVTDMDTNRLTAIKERYPQPESDHLILPTITLDKVIDRDPWNERFKSLVVEDFFVHKKLLDFYHDLFLITEFFRLHAVPYLIFSGAKNEDCPLHCFPAIDNLQLVQSVKNDPWVYKMHDFSLSRWAHKNDPNCTKKSGHLSESGHLMFASWLINLIGETHGT